MWPMQVQSPDETQMTVKHENMGLGNLPQQNRHNDAGYARVFNNTWGHYAPQKIPLILELLHFA